MQATPTSREPTAPRKTLELPSCGSASILLLPCREPVRCWPNSAMTPGEAALLQKAQGMNAEEWSHHCPELAPKTLSFMEIHLTHE